MQSSGATQTPSPQSLQSPQSTGQVAQSSAGRSHTASPQNGSMGIPVSSKVVVKPVSVVKSVSLSDSVPGTGTRSSCRSVRPHATTNTHIESTNQPSRLSTKRPQPKFMGFDPTILLL